MKIAVLKGFGSIAPYVIDGYIKAFREYGCKVKEIQLEGGFRFNDDNLNDVVKFKPNFILAYGGNGFIKHEDIYLFRFLGIPLISLYFDVPFVSMSKDIENEMKNYPDYYYSFIWDEFFLQLFQEKGLKNSYPIMLATDPSIFYPKENLKLDKTISFVGIIDETHMLTNSNSQEVNTFIDEVINLKKNNLGMPILEICCHLFGMLKYKNILEIYSKSNEIFWKIVYYIINQKGSSLIRKFVLESIDYNEVNVYGSTPFNKSNMKFHNNVAYGDELSEVFQSSKINLNISAMQLESSVNNRIFDVFASKGFLLTDYRKDIEKVFPKVWSEIIYKDIDDLKEKVKYFLCNDKRRQEISDELYHIVISKHTYKQRVEYIVNILKLKKVEVFYD